MKRKCLYGNCFWIFSVGLHLYVSGKMDALKELETLVKVEGRGKLISSNSKMGRE